MNRSKSPHSRAAFSAFPIFPIFSSITALAFSFCLAAPPLQAQGFSASVPAGGKHEITMPIGKWGRYSVRASGEQPVSLSISDRRNGVIARDGTAGQRNPRIDLFLDVGEYKLSAQGAKNATGMSALSATAFAYPKGFSPGYLVPARENSLALEDFQQACFWFQASADTVVYVEAAGRNLAELALWRDGEWLVPTQNRAFTAKPKEETPLAGISFSARLPKGAYMVGAYGGKEGGTGRGWALASQAHPLYLQAGLDSLSANTRAGGAIPPRGYAQWLLSPSVDAVIVAEAEKRGLLAEVNRLSPEFAPAGWLAADSITGKSASARVILRPDALAQGQGWRVLKVSGAPGQAFTVQAFGSSKTVLPGRESRNWWVTSMHSGDPQDQIGASGAVVDRKSGALVALQADTLSQDREWSRRFNLMAAVSAYIWVDGNGKYAVTPGGAAGSWRLSRYFHTPPPNYKSPEWVTGSKSQELIRGLYLLEVEPNEKGIATMIIAKSSLLGGALAAGKALLGSTARAWNAPRASLAFPRLDPGPDDSYQVILNSQAPELSAVFSRTWAPGAGNPSAATPAVADAGFSGPAFTEEKRAALPRFPVIEAGQTAFLDLDRGANRLYAVHVREPGIYRIETTGRLPVPV